MTAGAMNGTYPFPIKYMGSWKEENIWIVFSFITFLLLPWISLAVINYEAIELIRHMPPAIFYALLLGGLSFGLGMIIFTLALRFVGIGISFMLNTASGTVIATLLPTIVLNPQKLLSWFGLAEILALIFFCAAMFFSYRASCYKAKSRSLEGGVHDTAHAKRGLFIGILSGVFTSGQGFSYAYATTILSEKMVGYSKSAIMNAPWPLIFSAAFFPYFIYFLVKAMRKKALKYFMAKQSITYIFFCILMGILYFGSILVFGQSSLAIGPLGVTITWPMFMIFIILTSNVWGFLHQEWKGAHRLAFSYLSLSLTSLILAIAALSYAGYLNA